MKWFCWRLLPLLSACLILLQTGIYGKPAIQKLGDQVDLIIFSYDRPMQLYAYLESLDQLVKNLHHIYVLYRTSDDAFDTAYAAVKRTFPDVSFVQQTRTPSGDFKPLLLHLCFKKSTAPYVMFGVDDIIITHECNVATCAQVLKQTGAYGFYLRLGKNITTHYGLPAGQTVVQPPLQEDSDGTYRWQFIGNDFFNPWHYPHSVDMTIFSKQMIEPALRGLTYTSPNSLEHAWAHQVSLPAGAQALCFEHSCMVNMPLNLVQEYQDKHMNFETTEQLLRRFIKGEKIDVSKLYRYNNNSPHEDVVPHFIAR